MESGKSKTVTIMTQACSEREAFRELSPSGMGNHKILPTIMFIIISLIKVKNLGT